MRPIADRGDVAPAVVGVCQTLALVPIAVLQHYNLRSCPRAIQISVGVARGQNGFVAFTHHNLTQPSQPVVAEVFLY